MLIICLDREHQKVSSFSVTIRTSMVSKDKAAGVCKGVKGNMTSKQKGSFKL